MSQHDHLIAKFGASEETNDLATKLLRQATVKTAPGSGYDVGNLSVGVPAVCTLLASERLNNGEVKRATAQNASCLNKQQFQRVYNLVQAALEKSEDESGYDYLHEKYKTASLDSILKPFFNDMEKELKRLNAKSRDEEGMIKYVAYFWVCACAKVTTITGTEIFATENKLPIKKFIAMLQSLNDNCFPLRNTIRDNVKSISSSPIKRVNATASSSKAATIEREPQTPSRRSLRNIATLPISPTKTPTTKHTSKTSPTKIAQPTVVGTPWKKKNAPMREMPTNDTPKKRPPPTEKVDDQATAQGDFPEPPSKKRRGEPVTPHKLSLRSNSPSKPAALSSSPTKNRIISSPTKSSPMKAPIPKVLPTAIIAPESDEENEIDFLPTTRRFRPVYLDFKQWNTQDPRINKMLKKINQLDFERAPAPPQR